MSKSKMHKQEVGKSRPTENRASKLMVDEQVEAWLQKIRDANNPDDERATITGTTYILLDLIGQTKSGLVDRQVISKVVNAAKCGLSLQKAYEKLQGRAK